MDGSCWSVLQLMILSVIKDKVETIFLVSGKLSVRADERDAITDSLCDYKTVVRIAMVTNYWQACIFLKVAHVDWNNVYTHQIKPFGKLFNVCQIIACSRCDFPNLKQMYQFMYAHSARVEYVCIVYQYASCVNADAIHVVCRHEHEDVGVKEIPHLSTALISCTSILNLSLSSEKNHLP